MAEVKNLFVKSKMNKDLDARLLTNGEYRDAQNISVSKSEGADVGAVENILGNIELIDFETIVTNAVTAKYNALGWTIDTDAINYKNLEVIGQASNMETDSVVVFLTDWTDTSNDKLSNFPGNIMVTNSKGTNVLEYAGPGCFICYYNFQTGISSILAAGSYLNFSKSHPILGADYLEDFLYFTDNRNQPRKINVSTALARPYTSSSPYYGSEDDISVCKYAPYESIGFVDASTNSTLVTKSEQFLPSNITANTTGTTSGSVFTLVGAYSNPDQITGNPNPSRLNIPSLGQSYIIDSTNIVGSNTEVTVTTTITPAVGNGTRVTIEKPNPDYSSSFAGDADLLKEEFPRYSYRYRYDDGEYSLMAPFSQIAFIPEQYGYFLHDDERLAGESGIVKFMENRVDQIFLQIPMPALQSQLADLYKISELQILVKNAGDTTVKVIEDVLVNNLSYTSNTYSYQYDSTQPFKTLPENEITRVSDKAPIRAASQAIIGNRGVYGNFLDKHTHPISLDFSAKVEQKNSIATSTIRKEFPNHTLKQNRTYQLGLVLMDRYGRSSGVITSDNLAVISGSNKKSSIYANYSNADTSALNWAGNCLGLIMNEPIPSFMSEEGYPGLYGYENPLGWYSYKVVVKQTEQEYYNVYVPGAIAGNITWNKKEEVTQFVDNSHSATDSAVIEMASVANLGAGMTWLRNDENKGLYIVSRDTAPSPPTITLNEPVTIAADTEMTFEDIQYPTYPNPYNTSNIVLFGDNINKVPRDLNKVGPTDRIYASDVRLFNRVNPLYTASGTHNFYNTQHTFASPLVGDEAVSIRPFRDLGEWTLQSSKYYPTTTTAGLAVVGGEKLQLFYKANDNPFIATLTTNSLIGINPVLNTAGTYTDRTLGVFETEPTTSLLDIFWETSTAGLISDLNTAVDTGNEGPVSFTEIGFNLTEGMASGTQITNFFELVRSDGNPTADASEINMSNLRVIDGTGADRSIDFELVANIANPNTQFAIITKTEFYYGSNAGTEESFTFTIDCVANDIQNTISFAGQLSNVTPYVPDNMYMQKGIPYAGPIKFFFEPFSYFFPLPQPYFYDIGTISPTFDISIGTFLTSFDALNGFNLTDVNSLLKAKDELVVVFDNKPYDSSTGQLITYSQPDFLTYSYDSSNSGGTIKKYNARFNRSLINQVGFYWELNIKIYDSIPGGGSGVFLPSNSPVTPSAQNNNVLEFTIRYRINDTP